uniref:Uncharacterized protein n=1 Tax=Plectus sambesii TaxID=2011161 RepID=A0A914V4L7_9BILA
MSGRFTALLFAVVLIFCLWHASAEELDDSAALRSLGNAENDAPSSAESETSNRPKRYYLWDGIDPPRPSLRKRDFAERQLDNMVRRLLQRPFKKVLL